MASSGDDDRCVDGVGIHAGLIIMVHGYERPVCDDTSDTKRAIGVLAGDEVFDCGGVEEFDVREREDFGEESGCEECLDHSISVGVSFSIIIMR